MLVEPIIGNQPSLKEVETQTVLQEPIIQMSDSQISNGRSELELLKQKLKQD